MQATPTNGNSLRFAIKLALCSTIADAPPIKPWGTANKNYLQKLIKKIKVNITKTANLANIHQVRFDHFRHHDSHNFPRNFSSYARSRELEDHLSGYR
jgi:hypothetical protein